MAVQFNHAAALEHQLERQLSALRAMMRTENCEPEHSVMEAVVDMASLLQAYTTMAESGISPLRPVEELTRLIDRKMADFANRFPRDESRGNSFGGVESSQEGTVLSDWHRDLCAIADVIGALQVVLHLPDHRGICDA